MGTLGSRLSIERLDGLQCVWIWKGNDAGLVDEKIIDVDTVVVGEMGEIEDRSGRLGGQLLCSRLFVAGSGLRDVVVTSCFLHGSRRRST